MAFELRNLNDSAVSISIHCILEPTQARIMNPTATVPLLTRPQIAELCQFAEWADREARTDLVGGYIRDEDDYTSNFTGALRRIINSNSTTGLRATSRLLTTSEERSMGCDAAIIVRGRAGRKIALFEAKLPRIASAHVRWDYRQTSTGLSHFSDQLARQAVYANQFAIFEMFYCELPFRAQPSPFLDFLSACVWHANALAFDPTRSRSPEPWDYDELLDLLAIGVVTVADVLRNLCECRVGHVFNGNLDVDGFIGEFRLEGHILEVDATGEG
jgi:hypothetical protein